MSLSSCASSPPLQKWGQGGFNSAAFAAVPPEIPLDPPFAKGEGK